MIQDSEDSESELMPTTEEISKYILNKLNHSLVVEYFINFLKMGDYDRQRPHDLVGPGNKFVWAVMKRLSLQDRVDYSKDDYVNDPIFKNYILKGIIFHRRYQGHHEGCGWNNGVYGNGLNSCDIEGKDLSVYGVSGIDAIVSNMGEDRPWQSGEDIVKIINDTRKKGQPNKADVMEQLWFLMARHVGIAKSKELRSLSELSENVFNLPLDIYDSIVQRTNYVLEMLTHFGYSDL